MSDPRPDQPVVTPTAANRRQAVAKWCVKALMAVGILWLLFTQVDLAGVWAAVWSASGPWVTAAFAAALLLQVAVADRLRRLIASQGVGLDTAEVFEINLSTLFYGLFLPGGNFTGIAIRFYRLGATDHGMLKVGVALFLDRIVATLTLLIVGVGFWLIEQPSFAMTPLWLMVGASVALFVLIVVLFAPAPTPVVGTFQRVLRRVGGAKINRLCDAMQSQWEAPPRVLGLVFVLSLGSHVLGVFAYWAVARAMGLDLSLVSIGWVRSAMILATMLPLTPSGVGLREGATWQLLGLYGVTAEAAVAYALVVFGSTILAVGLVGGGFEAWRWMRPRGSKGSENATGQGG